MDCQHLTDEELIHYALLDAQPGTLAGVLAQRYADNVCNVAELEESQRKEIEELTTAYEHERSEIEDAHSAEITELENAALLA
jgi:hypothetical protein